jgi:hypothetical protein
LLSAGCLFWLERLQPLFFTVAIGALLYQAWLVWSRPFSRTRGVKAIFTISATLNVLVIGAWVVLWFRYR